MFLEKMLRAHDESHKELLIASHGKRAFSELACADSVPLAKKSCRSGWKQEVLHHDSELRAQFHRLYARHSLLDDMLE